MYPISHRQEKPEAKYGNQKMDEIYLSMIDFPVSVDPVKPTFLTSGWAQILLPTTEPEKREDTQTCYSWLSKFEFFLTEVAHPKHLTQRP